MHFHPVYALLVIPALLVFSLLSLPYINYDTETDGVWFGSAKGRKMVLVALVLAVAATVSSVWLDEFVINSDLGGAHGATGNGLLLFAFFLATCALDLYPVAIENNVIKVNAARPARRSEFTADQVAYPGKT